MSRSVTVKLTADAGEYIVTVKEAKVQTEELDRKVKGVDDSLKKIPPDAAKAAASMKLLGGDAKGVGNQLTNTGTDGVTALSLIDKRIADVRSNIKGFASDFNKTGSLDSFSLWKSATGDLKDLEKIKKDLTGALTLGAKEGEKAISGAIDVGGKEGSKSLLASLQGVLSTPVLGPLTVGAITAGIVVLAPAIGAAIGAAVIGSAGLGTIGLAIATQVQSPAVQSAFGQLKQRATDDLTAAGRSFEPVIVQGLHGFSDELDHIAPEIQRNITKLAIPASHLFDGISQFLDHLGPGIDDLTSAAAPFIDMLAAELPQFADALSQMFHDISSGAPGAILFFHDLLRVIDLLIVATGEFAGIMEKIYGGLRIVSKGLFGGDAAGAARDWETLKGAQDGVAKSAKTLKTNMEVAAASVDIAGGKAMSASDQYGMLISQLNAVNNTADKVAGAMVDAIINPMLNADRAANAFDKSLVTLGDTLEKNGGQLTEHVKALKKAQTGQQDNKDAILAVVEANLREYDSQIAVGVAATDAAAKYDVNTKALEDQLHAAGYTAAQIDDLIGKYRNVPDKVNTAIAIDGLASAINDLNELIRQINGLHSKTITIAEEHTYTYQDPSQYYHGHGATGGIRTAAAGTLVMPRNPGTLLIGEPQTGGEALIPLQGISQMRAAALGQVAMSGYGMDVVPRGYRAGPMVAGGGTLRVELAFAGGNDALSSLLAKMQRTGDLQLTATRV